MIDVEGNVMVGERERGEAGTWCFKQRKRLVQNLGGEGNREGTEGARRSIVSREADPGGFHIEGMAVWEMRGAQGL